jgi:hypothetical protein
MQHGYQCGMTWGAALAAGAQAYRLFGPGTQAETAAIIAAQGLAGSFRALNKGINCFDVTGLDKSSSAMQMSVYFLLKGGIINCFRMAARYAPAAFCEINTTFSEEHIDAPAPPVSCAAMLARQMGVSDMHTVMAAGFAGGIGLSGSGCGALGAAIWIIGMNCIEEGDGKIDLQMPQGTDMIDRFAKCTGGKFRCSEIVGRKFENVGDHADYLRDGGCSEIIGVLAAQ